VSVSKSAVISAISPPLPRDIVTQLLDEYQHIKQQFFLRKFQPSELNGGRFGECVVRLIQWLDTGAYTPLGTSLGNTETILNHAHQNVTLPETARFYINRLTRVILDIRNKRDVAHVGGKVSPNYSDSLLVCQCADWILTDIIREYHTCPIDTARQMVANINEVHIPIVAEINGWIRIQDTKLDARKKTLVILYYKKPNKVQDSDLAKWIEYQNVPRYRTTVLKELHTEALIHYMSGQCELLPFGVQYVEKNIRMELLV
jgi:hypothetical protein